MYKDGTKPYTGPLPNARNAEYERKARAEKKRQEEEQRKAQQEKKALCISIASLLLSIPALIGA